MAHKPDDATVWVGYADFLTTLTVLFFVLFIVIQRGGHATVTGEIRDAASNRPLSGCQVSVSHRRVESDSVGAFNVSLDSIHGAGTAAVAVSCDGFAQWQQSIDVRAKDTTRLKVAVVREDVMRVHTLSGDALFGTSEAQLTPAAVDTIAKLGRTLSSELSEDEMIAVQGHTDDQPFQKLSGKDNWVLSGERAAAAAQVLVHDGGVSECRVVIMGFGPSRPAAPLAPGDSPGVRKLKREKNRRIEFRLIRGTVLTGGACGLD